MANLRDIRRRIKSVKNTAQITKAMQMVAASKMRKAQQAALNGRDYAHLLNQVIVSLKETLEKTAHPFLEERDVKNHLVILMSTDKGLCGALNTNILREASNLDPAKTQFVSIGRKGTQFLARTKRNVIADFPLSERPNFSQCKKVSKFCIEKFLDGTVDKVSILYPRFANTLSQIPTDLQILPVTSLEEAGILSNYEAAPPPEAGFTFEPNANSVLNAILPAYLHYIVFQTQLSTRASEQSARMVAMKNATDNAKGLVKDLTLEYNKARQASITNEILEIATAQLALG
ncbi:MAG: ATP synthase F1 subunit gamma [bacterium]